MAEWQTEQPLLQDVVAMRPLVSLRPGHLIANDNRRANVAVALRPLRQPALNHNAIAKTHVPRPVGRIDGQMHRVFDP